MLIITRHPADKPKRPKAPTITRHFTENWHVRTGLSLATFERRWKSARFLGETERSRWGHHPNDWGRTGRVRYWGIDPDWVVLVSAPVSGQPVCLSLWPSAWFEQEWQQAQDPDHPREESLSPEEPPSNALDIAAAAFACAPTDAWE